MIWDVFGNHRARTDKGVFANGGPADDGGICAETRPAPDESSLIFVFPVDVASRVDHIGEAHRRTTKNIVLKLDAGIKRNIVLNLDVIPDLHVACDMDILT